MTYRTRQRLRRFGVTIAYVLLAVILVGVCWFVWLERFVVYDGEGAHLVFDYVSPEGTAQVAEPPQPQTVAIRYNEGEEYEQTSSELTQIQGYYATTSVLTGGVDKVESAISALPSGSAVMLDVKNGAGEFFYSSGLPSASITNKIDVTQMDQLIDQLSDAGVYLIARIPAFRDRAFGLENTNSGLAHSSGGYLWADAENCYWLNPTDSDTLNWLVSIVNELRALGFDEVVFTDFKFPDTDSILFDSSSTSRLEALQSAAETLVSTCSSTRFAVSFEITDPAFRLPEGRSRLYLTGVDAAQAATVAESTAVADKTANLVFRTETNDTRFDAFSAMRPMPVPN